jgi:hypothetical protein
MQVDKIEKATIIEFTWNCGCKRIVERSECGNFKDTERCDHKHGKLQLSQAVRRLYC